MDSMGNCKGPIIKQGLKQPGFQWKVSASFSFWVLVPSWTSDQKQHEPSDMNHEILVGWLVGWLEWNDPCSLVMASEIIPNKNWVGISPLSPLSGKQQVLAAF